MSREWVDGGGAYFKANCEEDEDFQHHVVAVLVESVKLGFVVDERGWEGLLSFPIDKFSEVHGSGSKGKQDV